MATQAPATSNKRLPSSEAKRPATKHGAPPGNTNALKPCPEPVEGTAADRQSRSRRGAPKGNLNALKHGRYSQRVTDQRLIYDAIQRNLPQLAGLARLETRRRQLLARALHTIADLLLAHPGPAGTIEEITPALIRKAANLAKNAENKGTTPAAAEPRLPLGGAKEHNHSAMADSPPIRVLIAKPGLDGHDRGAKVVARALRDAGMEVIYTGIRQTPEMIAEAALQEDVRVIGLSILSGAHLELFPRVVQALKDRGIDPNDVLLFAGGIIPDEDIPVLKQLGFRAVFRPGASTQDIIDYVRTWADERAPAPAAEGGAASEP